MSMDVAIERKKRRYARNPVKAITSEWVESHCVNVTPRDREMLKLLNRFPLLNSEQLYLLTPSAGKQEAFHRISQGRKRCNERIRALYDMYCVNKAAPKLPMGEGTSKQYVWIDRAGLKLLQEERRARNELPQDYKHKSLVIDVYCHLIIGERENIWENRYLEVEKPYRNRSIIPDLTILIKFKGGPRGAFYAIEVDRSEKKESVEKAKLRSYRDWELSRQWVTEPFAAKLPQPCFPQVLYLFDESKPRWTRRLKLLEAEAERIGLNAKFMGITKFRSYLLSLQ